ncbi:MAG: hypothetical protein IT303_03575 [Dehalococcoidia bacterium]|nr:hypothetical protein [Dehalococcoidia bacterium]
MGMLIDLQAAAGPALVIGGGAIALRKVRNLVEGGFEVVVVAPVVTAGLAGPGVTVISRPFEGADITATPRWSLVFACTDDRQVNRRAGELARAHGIPVVVADARDESTFFTPAVLRDGGAAVAVSTGGAGPALAAGLRDRIEAALGPGWGAGVAAARAARAARGAAAE